MTGGIVSRLDGGVGRIEIARPERRNAFDGPTLEAFGAAFSALSADPDCRVIVLSGQGPVFCAGWDTGEFAALAALGEAGLKAAFARNARVLEQVSATDRIVVSVVRGACMGFGLSLAARSDLCLAGEGARFALPELSHSIAPGMVMEDAVRTLGLRRTLDWVLTREARSAAQARDEGLVSRVIADAALEAVSETLIAGLAALDPAVAGPVKRLARGFAAGEATLDDAIAVSTTSVLALLDRTPAP